MVGEVEKSNWTAAQPTEIADADGARNRSGSRIMVHNISYRSRPHQKSVVIIVYRRVVLVPGDNKFGGVARKEKILQIDIAQHHLLVAAIECIQSTVGIFFQELEVSGVVFDLI